uniref:Uncharacterized protein n=1 Tax=Oryza brachyantha TaxID=4533 RepID=J3MMA8_ORYBR
MLTGEDAAENSRTTALLLAAAQAAGELARQETRRERVCGSDADGRNILEGKFLGKITAAICHLSKFLFLLVTCAAEFFALLFSVFCTHIF